MRGESRRQRRVLEMHGDMGHTASNGKGLPSEGNPLVSLARELNLDVASFQKCLDSGDATQLPTDQKDAMGPG